MDIVGDFLRTLNIGSSDKFIVSGNSKRGWDTWLITAIDKRVIASIPIVFDILNWNKVMNFYSSLVLRQLQRV